jgi:hypothetical protein
LLSRPTIIELTGVLVARAREHAPLTIKLTRFGLEEVAPESMGGLEKRKAALLGYLVRNPDTQGPGGSNLAFELAEHVVAKIHSSVTSRFYGKTTVEAEYPELVNALRQDGIDIIDGRLVRSFPAELDLPEAKDELHGLLERFDFSTSLGHLDQSLSAHARGQWASANANLRTFFESLLDDISFHLWPDASADKNTSHARRELLAQGSHESPPFLLSELNEWQLGGRGGFLRGIWERLHPDGSHPGLSDEEDSTLRLHVVLLVARHLLRRLDRRTGS